MMTKLATSNDVDPPSTMSEEVKKLITLDEVKQHTTADSCWLVIGNSSNGTWK
jgi:hypothetical protein